MRAELRIPLVAGGVLTVFAIDQSTKTAALSFLPEHVPVPVTSFFALTLGYNTGISFGMLRQVPANVLAFGTLLILGAVLVWAVRSKENAEALGLSMIAGGAAGNLIDRVARGAVTDFLDFHIGELYWPTFNFADVAITAGACLFLAPIFFQQGRKKRLDDVQLEAPTAEGSAAAADETLRFSPKFDSRGLLAVVVTDANSGAVLGLKRMDRAALSRTIQTGVAHYTPSRDGAAKEAGKERILELLVDCDQDAVLVRILFEKPEPASAFDRVISLGREDGA